MKILKIAAAVVALSAPATFVQAQTVGIGTTAQGSITYSVGAAIAKAVTENTDLQVRVQPGGGQNVALPAVNAGEIEFGIANEQQYYEAVQGIGAFEGPKMENLRAVAVLMPLRVAMFVKPDSPVQTAADLKGMRVPSDFRAQRALGQIVKGILANSGLSYDDVKPVPVTNVIQGAQDFAAGKTDVMFFALGAGQVQEVGTQVGGLRALPIDPSEEAMERFREHFPVAFATEVQPSPALYGVLEPVQLTAFDQLLVANVDVSDEIVAQVVETMHGAKEDFIATFRPFGQAFDPARMAKPIPVGSYHEGAVPFYKQAGVWPQP